MGYRIDPADTGGAPPPDATIVLVGCGGTGGFLAEALCRLLLGRPGSLHLIDMDRVEPHNLLRQSFDRADVGRFKAQVLAERLARRFGRPVSYSVLPYNADLHAEVFGEAGAGLRLVIGCVDNGAARRALAATLDSPRWRDAYPPAPPDTWWLDCGNGRNSGQVLLGNATRPQELRGAFEPETRLCRALPAPGLQRPDLLEAPPPAAQRLDCAEAVARGDQGPTINQVVAALAASYVERLLDGTCAWLASYFDLDDGTLRCMPADPRSVAGLVGLRPQALVPASRRRRA